MKPEKTYKAQGYLFFLAAIGALVSFSSKGVLAKNVSISAFIQFQYFVYNFSQGDIWVYAYWFSSALFLSSIAVAIFLQLRKRKDSNGNG